VSLILVAILLAEQTTSRWQIATPKWARRAKWFALLATYTMNTWQSWADRDAAAVVLHSVPPLMVVVAVEAAPAMRDALTEAVHRAAEHAAMNATATVREPAARPFAGAVREPLRPSTSTDAATAARPFTGAGDQPAARRPIEGADELPAPTPAGAPVVPPAAQPAPATILVRAGADEDRPAVTTAGAGDDGAKPEHPVNGAPGALDTFSAAVHEAARNRAPETTVNGDGRPPNRTVNGGGQPPKGAVNGGVHERPETREATGRGKRKLLSDFVDDARAAYHPGIEITPAWVREVTDCSRGLSPKVARALQHGNPNEIKVVA